MNEKILPSFCLTKTQNLQCEFLEFDNTCSDNFNSEYPHNVNYCFNSRGYRDSEWPNNLVDLKSAVWCIGDSATVGIGSPLEHIWPQVLSNAWQTRTINVSMIASSNDFLERKCIELLDQVRPRCIVICWSFLHRRDKTEIDKHKFIANETQRHWDEFYQAIAEQNWPYCSSLDNIVHLPQYIQNEIRERYQVPEIMYTDEMYSDASNFKNHQWQAARRSDQEEIDYFLSKINNIQSRQGLTKIFHLFIPEFASKIQTKMLQQHLESLNIFYYFIKQKDLSRDNFHWDLLTSRDIVQQLTTLNNIYENTINSHRPPRFR